MPKILKEHLYDYENKQSLSDRIAELTASARASFDRTPAPTEPTLPVDLPTPEVSAPVAEVSPASVAEQRRAIGDYGVNLSSVPADFQRPGG